MTKRLKLPKINLELGLTYGHYKDLTPFNSSNYWDFMRDSNQNPQLPRKLTNVRMALNCNIPINGYTLSEINGAIQHIKYNNDKINLFNTIVKEMQNFILLNFPTDTHSTSSDSEFSTFTPINMDWINNTVVYRSHMYYYGYIDKKIPANFDEEYVILEFIQNFLTMGIKEFLTLKASFGPWAYILPDNTPVGINTADAFIKIRRNNLLILQELMTQKA